MEDGPPSPETTSGGLNANCVQIVGFSQTRQWFSSSDDGFESQVGDGMWEALIQGGGSIDRWMDPQFSGWANPLTSPCKSGPNDPDIVLFTISGGNRELGDWVDAIEEMLDTIAIKVPSAEHIILQPVVGGPGESLCPSGRGEDVRASENHQVIDSAIAQVAAAHADVLSGASPEVGSCDHYSDEVGHLTEAGGNFVAGELAQFYDDFVN